MKSSYKSGFTLVEVLVSILITGLAFMLFLQALNTGKNVRVKSELRTRQSALLNSIENLIRARRFDENNLAPWTSAVSLGVDSNETSINQFDDVDDFNNYNTASILDYPGFSYDIKVFYSEPEILTGVNAEKYFFTYSDDQTNYKSIAISVSHLTLNTLNDTLIITPKP